jgi:hypothetical protein
MKMDSLQSKDSALPAAHGRVGDISGLVVSATMLNSNTQ